MMEEKIIDGIINENQKLIKEKEDLKLNYENIITEIKEKNHFI